MREAVVALVVLTLLAGCAADPPHPPASPDPAAASQTTSMAPPAAPGIRANTTFVRAFTWTDTLPAGAWVCEGTTGTCQYYPEGAYGMHHEEELIAGDLVGGNLTLSWDAASPASAQMSLGAIAITPGCDTCNSTHLASDVSGPSPLAFPLPMGFRFETGQQLQVWVYSSSYEVAGPEAAGASETQGFTVKADLLLQPYAQPLH